MQLLYVFFTAYCNTLVIVGSINQKFQMYNVVVIFSNFLKMLTYNLVCWNLALFTDFFFCSFADQYEYSQNNSASLILGILDVSSY